MERMNFLIFDTSCSQLKVGLSINNKKHYVEYDKGFTHIENLLPAVNECFEALNENKNELDIIGVCTGPGSFTGLRIGIATAMGISYASGLKSFGFSVFDVYQFLFRDDNNSIIIPIIDAKKARFYTSFIQKNSAVKMHDIELQKIVQKIKKIKALKKIIFTGKDFKIIKDQIVLNKINFIEKYSNNYTAQDIVNYTEFILSSGSKLVKPKPIYLRKSEAEIMLLKKKLKSVGKS